MRRDRRLRVEVRAAVVKAELACAACLDLDPRPQSLAVRRAPLQHDVEPVLRRTGVAQQPVRPLIERRRSPAVGQEEILPTVAVEVEEVRPDAPTVAARRRRAGRRRNRRRSRARASARRGDCGPRRRRHRYPRRRDRAARRCRRPPIAPPARCRRGRATPSTRARTHRTHRPFHKTPPVAGGRWNPCGTVAVTRTECRSDGDPHCRAIAGARKTRRDRKRKESRSAHPARERTRDRRRARRRWRPRARTRTSRVPRVAPRRTSRARGQRVRRSRTDRARRVSPLPLLSKSSPLGPSRAKKANVMRPSSCSRATSEKSDP